MDWIAVRDPRNPPRELISREGTVFSGSKSKEAEVRVTGDSLGPHGWGEPRQRRKGLL